MCRCYTVTLSRRLELPSFIVSGGIMSSVNESECSKHSLVPGNMSNVAVCYASKSPETPP